MFALGCADGCLPQSSDMRPLCAHNIVSVVMCEFLGCTCSTHAMKGSTSTETPNMNVSLCMFCSMANAHLAAVL